MLSAMPYTGISFFYTFIPDRHFFFKPSSQTGILF